MGKTRTAIRRATVVIAPDDRRTGLCRTTIRNIEEFDKTFVGVDNELRANVHEWLLCLLVDVVDVIHTPEQGKDNG